MRRERAGVGLTWNLAAGHWDLDQQRLLAALERDPALLAAVEKDAAVTETDERALKALDDFRARHGGVWPDAFADRRGVPDFKEAKLARGVARVATKYSQEVVRIWLDRTCSDWLRLAGCGGEVLLSLIHI